MIGDFENVSNKDLLRERTIDLGSNKFKLRQTDPYGFWTIAFERGAVPDHLKGQYTTYDQAERAINQYVAEKGREIKSVTK